MPRQFQINLNLTTSVTHDLQTGNFAVYYEEFPQAIASGVTEDEAENNLIFLVEDMWKKRPNDLQKFLSENHIKDFHIKSPSKLAN